jgi:1-aminocyclopropane-1-carboxylate deaminase/D-cysteine desulfhydrase-like pyridoxal-dependent ACC family enzyme
MIMWPRLQTKWALYIRQWMLENSFDSILLFTKPKGWDTAASTPEELDFVSKFAVETGVVLDPVYSGKALYHFLTQVVQEDSDEYQGKNVLFWHTGGALGLYDKGEALLDTLNQISPVKRLDVYEKGGKDEVKI